MSHSEANVHPRTRTLVWNDFERFWVGFKRAINQICLFLGDFLLSIDFVGVGGKGVLEDLTGDVDTASN